MAFYPFYQELRDESLKMAKGNFGLWYNKFVPLSDGFKAADENGRDTAPIEYYSKKYNQMKNSGADLLRRKLDDQDDYCAGFPMDKYEEIIVCAKLAAPLITGIGESHPHEVSMVFDHNMGIPYIPASGVKGIVRFAHTLSLFLDKDGNIMEEFNDKDCIDESMTDIPDIFGGEKENSKENEKKKILRGKVVFLDAYPAAVPDLHIDIMNPHYGPYYMDGKPPADHHNPTPIKFLTVKSGITFIFRAVAEKTDDMPQKVRAAFMRALMEEGVGAKTAVGYGRFIVDEQGHRDLLEKRKKRREEIENRRTPWRAYIGRVNAVSDWGQLKNILEHDVLKTFRNEREVADTVKNKALVIREKWRKSWSLDRDAEVSTWLELSGIGWQSLPVVNDVPAEELSEECKRIDAMRDWGAFKSESVNPETLSRDALHLLKKKMESWGCNDKKAKSDKKETYKKVKNLLK